VTTKNHKAQWLRDNQRKGEGYAGLILGKDGAPDHHLFVIPGEAEKVTFAEAQKWTKKQGGDLPTRREQRVLFANAKEAFQADLYWSGEPHASDARSAWYQGFSTGRQSDGNVSDPCRARAVRRLIIE